MSTDLQQLAERYAQAWASHDPDEIVALHTEDTVFQLHAGQEPAEGRDAAREAFAGMFALMPDLAFEPVSLRFGDGHWVAEWRIKATTPEGRAVDADLIDVIEVRDGLVHSKHSYVDALTLQAQLGLAPAAA